ncbi:beta-glucoside-specific PTS transporter subunit IIABC [Tetragenococcus muriaticus]|uniref:beta-glucoside-specific PTS transporter subunit IIABC n=1 Tax=Tetragenococcus muriaticus TaxID=64642 RepID=UPI0003F8FD63|nr:beta-glucoside-specific PTS transporter subunit IIABC [Tetragenococcus muriaticus]GMA47578.1 PTS beta-glucoside transporter subunit EIIBCA [Tetragenococcus muriaticus]
MSKKYESLAKSIADKVGGSENVETLAHCQTRMRFVLHDNSKADKEGIKNLDGVANVIESGGQFQVVIGTHVEQVYEEVTKFISPNLDEEPVQEDNRNLFNRLIDFISGTFSPVIPAISGAGMVKALLALLVLFNVVSGDSQTYYVIDFMADAVFYFLPVFLAYTAASKLKCSPYLAVALAGILLHPNFSALVEEGEAVSVFGIPMELATYSTSVIPILLIVFAQKYIEGFARRITPDAVKIVIVPMITIFVTGLIGLLILGPIGSYAGNYLADGFEAMQNYGPWLPPTLIGAFLPVMVIFGLHHSVAPLGFMQLAAFGYEGIFGPGAMVSNIAMGVSVLVVSLRTQKQSEKQLATANGITGLMGVTEPALYGVALPKRYPLIASIIGGGFGGLYAGIVSTVRFGTGSSGLPAIPLYIGEDITNVINIAIALVIAAVISAILTYVLSFRFEKNQEVNESESKEVTLEGTIVSSPVAGELLPMSEVKDEAFASEALGKGFAIEPTEGTVVAPFDGKIATVFPSKHAIGLVSDTGMELLIHVGLNTVELNGQYFESFVEAEQPVKKGQMLLKFELDKIREAGYTTQIPVVVTNTLQYSEFELLNEGETSTEDPVLKVEV